MATRQSCGVLHTCDLEFLWAAHSLQRCEASKGHSTAPCHELQETADLFLTEAFKAFPEPLHLRTILVVQLELGVVLEVIQVNFG